MFRSTRKPGDLITTIELIGHINAAILPQLETQIDTAGRYVVLELGEVTLVDLEVIRFLINCLARGIELRGCSAYIREWIAREQDV
jgi:Zn finger protein HypA/HybF involved in hydrogenase expression